MCALLHVQYTMTVLSCPLGNLCSIVLTLSMNLNVYFRKKTHQLEIAYVPLLLILKKL